MTINLSKGTTLNLEKVLPNLEAAFVGLGWDVGSSADFDLDVSVFMLGANGKLASSKHLVFYNQKTSPEQPKPAIELTGDNRTGAGEGDDEAMIMDLRNVEAAVEELLVCITIHEADSRGQNFGMVKNAYVRMVNVTTKDELLRYDLDAEFSTETAVIMAKIKRDGAGWSMTAIGEGYPGSLEGLVGRYQ